VYLPVVDVVSTYRNVFFSRINNFKLVALSMPCIHFILINFLIFPALSGFLEAAGIYQFGLSSDEYEVRFIFLQDL